MLMDGIHFDWDKILEKDGDEQKKIRTFLIDKYELVWWKKQKLKKDKENIFKISSGNNSLSLKSNIEQLSWNAIQEMNIDSLKKCLIERYGVVWVEKAEIEKVYSHKIKISSEKNSLSLEINNEETLATLMINDYDIEKFQVKMNNGELKIETIWIKLDIKEVGKEKSERYPIKIIDRPIRRYIYVPGLQYRTPKDRVKGLIDYIKDVEIDTQAICDDKGEKLRYAVYLFGLSIALLMSYFYISTFNPSFKNLLKLWELGLNIIY